MIGLAPAGVRARDHAGHGLEHFANPHERADLELPGGNGALTGRLRDANQVLLRIFHVSQIGERAFPDDRHLRAERQVHHHVHPRHARDSS